MAPEQQHGSVWRKSARSGVQSNCVEARSDGVRVWVRNSNDVSPDRPVVAFAADQWLTLLDRVRAGDLALDRLGEPVRARNAALVSFDGLRVIVRADAGGPGVAYTPAEWLAFVEGVRHDGEFTLSWLTAPATA
ncbi:DUF397 domain-containing protein [Sphaerisporangium sp. NPDC051011]|uniref:DUF397 domain-containing protein n=1 Tax=Sphaerisporangium sp. NPDC051011 TaxID=3155792 RepID=UPI0033EA0A12